METVLTREKTASADQEATDLLVEGLSEATKGDGGNFAGYAPVLQALALQVTSYENPSELVSKLKANEEPITLERIIHGILEKEQRKISQNLFHNERLIDELYTPDEQIVSLINKIYDTNINCKLPPMEPDEIEKYNSMLSTWVDEHPFLVDGGSQTSSEVFSGYLGWRALIHEGSSEIARPKLLGNIKMNPFVSAFYLPKEWGECGHDSVFESLDDIPLVFASHLARVSPPDSITLDVRSDEDGGAVEVEIVWDSPRWDASKRLYTQVPKRGVLRFGRSVSHVSVDGADLDVEIGNGGETILGAPLSIDARSLILNGSHVVVESHGSNSPQSDNAISLRVLEMQSDIHSRPIVRGNVSLSVAWPGSEKFPWNEFSAEPPIDPPEGLKEAYQRLRKILLPFKSDRYGELGKYRNFVDSVRRTKGSGVKVRDQLLDEGVIRPKNYIYVLDQERLWEKLGLNYQKMRSYEIPEKTIDFLRRALDRAQ